MGLDGHPERGTVIQGQPQPRKYERPLPLESHRDSGRGRLDDSQGDYRFLRFFFLLSFSRLRRSLMASRSSGFPAAEGGA
jgi:hypothetical protein